MIELSRTQDEEVGDGTTSVIVLGMHVVCDTFFLAITIDDYKIIINLGPSFIIFISMSSEVIELWSIFQVCFWSK
jgi:hypothetical protein